MSKSQVIATPLRATEVKKALQRGEPTTLKAGGSLTLEIMGPNRARWIFRGRLAGTSRVVELVCGNASTSISDAKAKRDEYRLLLRKGIDPNELARQQLVQQKEEERQASKTFVVVAEEYFESRMDMSAKSLQTERGRVKNHMAPLQAMPITEIRRSTHLKPLIDTLSEQGKFEQAKRVAELIGRIFQYALNAGYIELSPAERLAKLVPRQAKGSKKHLAAVVEPVSVAELFQKLWAYMDSGRSSPHLVAAMKLSCYLPVRNSNMIEARWKDIDLDQKVWKFPETKNGHSYIVPITSQMQEVFEHLALYRTNQWCFPSGAQCGHISNTGLASILRRAGIRREEHTLHGFRSTFQTIALERGLPKVLCERLLFHVAGNAVEQAYNRARYLEPLIHALQWWNDTVDALRLGNAIPPIPAPLVGIYQ